MSRVVAVGLSATLQKTITFANLRQDCVNRSTGYRIDASGKAVNAARVLNQLSPGIVINVCPLGAENAQMFLDLATQDGMAVEWVPVPGRVRYCYTLLDPGTGKTTELVVSEPVGEADFSRATEKLLELIDRSLEGAEALLVAGSRPEAYPEDIYARICALAAGKGLLVMADFHGEGLIQTLKRSVPSIIKINEEEFRGTFGYRSPLDERELQARIAVRSAELGNTIVVTRGARDTYAAVQGTPYTWPVATVKALNATGCGDAFTAGFLYSWLERRDMRAALEKGSWCASRNALNLRPGSIRDPDARGEQIW